MSEPGADPPTTDANAERQRLQQAIESLEARRAMLSDSVVDAALAPMREKLLAIERENSLASDRAAERKHVTVMFADLSGFTALSERTDPEQVRSLVNGCFNALVPIVESYGGVVDKFIGDDIMALFGAPVTREDDAERALRASLDMMGALETFNKRHGADLQMHFGIATGRVVAGGLGSHGHQQYSVMGDAVNLAARLEDLSEPGQILVGEATQRFTAPLFRFSAMPPVRLKGKSEPVAVYRLLGRRGTPASRRAVDGLRSSMVGREVEMQAMLGAAYDLAQGSGGIIAIVGEAGIGKSRLLAEARHATSEDIRWIVAHAVSHAQGTSYALTGSLLDGLIGSTTESSRVELARALREFAGARLPDRRDEIFPYLARMRDLPLEANDARRLQELLPEALQARIRSAFVELIRACALQHPTALVCEDVHWADPSSLGVLDSLAQLSGSVPLLLVLVIRADESDAWQWHRKLEQEHGNRYRVLELSPLRSADAGKLIDNLLSVDDLPSAFRELVLAKSEGNPFFVEELLRSLIDSGLARGGGDQRVALEVASRLNAPDTVQSVVAARIDRLPVEAKRVLQTASVFGRLFPRGILDRVLQAESGDVPLDASLDELVHRELLRPHGASEYTFKHAITREVAYESLLLARRRHLHRRMAETMEAIYADRLDELAPTLAHHLVAGEAREKALRYLDIAADRARRTYANAEAIAFYRTAIQQVEELRRQPANREHWHEKAAALQEDMGVVLGKLGRVDEALRAYATARSLLQDTAFVSQARLYRREGIALSAPRRIPEMLAANDRAVAILGTPQEAADDAWWNEWIDLQTERMWGFYLAGRMPELMELIAQTRPVIDERGTPAQRVRALESMVLADLRRFRYFGLPDETLENARRQLDAAEASGTRQAIARANGVRGFVHLFRGELTDAERYLRLSLEHAEHVGDAEVQLIAMNWLGLVGRQRDDVSMARFWAERTLALSRTMKNLFYEASSLGSLGWVAWREGDDTQARSRLEESTALSAKIPSPIQFMAVGPLLALSIKHKDWPAALRYAQTLIHPSQRKMPEDIHALLDQAITAWNVHDAEGAESRIVQAVEMMRQQATGYV